MGKGKKDWNERKEAKRRIIKPKLTSWIDYVSENWIGLVQVISYTLSCNVVKFLAIEQNYGWACTRICFTLSWVKNNIHLPGVGTVVQQIKPYWHLLECWLLQFQPVMCQDGASAWGPTPIGWCCWLWPSACPDILAIWGANEWIEFSLPLPLPHPCCNSAFK